MRKILAAPLAKLLLALALLLAHTSRAETILIGADAQWRYADPEATYVNSIWTDVAFNDDGWKVGPAQLGYGDGDEATVITDHHPVTVVFRKTFNVDNPALFSKLIVRLLRDDGAIVYMNGHELLRSNMPDGAVFEDTLALTTVGADTENTFIPYEVSASSLNTGENVVAVEVHQVNVASSDLSFALQLIGVEGGVSDRPTVSITATQATTSESDPVSKMAPGRLLIKRTGSVDAMLPVWIRTDGTARAGLDYTTLPTKVEIPAGKESVELLVTPIDDFVKEPTETVAVKISEPPTSPDSIPYNIDASAAFATVSIFDSRAGIEITSPANGASFDLGATIQVTASAVVPGGIIPTVRFYDGDLLIGTSTPIFINPPTPGQVINHRIEWSNAMAGEHVITARGAVQDELGSVDGPIYISQKVTVRVRDTSVVPVLSIEAKWATTSEPLPNALVTPGLFVIHRSGPTNTAFSAWFAVAGTAIESVDYDSLPDLVEFKAGQVDAELKVVPKSDDLVEGDETVVVELIQPPTAGAVAWYTINADKRRAVVTIKDEDQPAKAHIEITSPQNGAMVEVGSTLTIKATAVDPDGYIPRVEFFSDGVSIGVSEINFFTAPDPGTPIYHSIQWANVPIGEHSLVAKGVRANGEAVSSAPVKIYVVHSDPPPRPIVSIYKMEDPTLRPIPNVDYASDFFEIRRTGPTNDALVIYFAVPQSDPQTATPDVDYKALKSPVTIPAGQASTTMRVEAIDDQLVEGPEIIRVELISAPPWAPPGENLYDVDPEHKVADVTILDNDQDPQRITVAVVTIDAVATEIPLPDYPNTAAFKIKRVSGPVEIEVTVNYEMSGVAENGVDYEKLSGTAVIPSGKDSTIIAVKPIADNLEERAESVVVTLMPPVCVAVEPSPADCYLIGDRNSATATIYDHKDQPPTIRILRPANGATFVVGEPIEIEIRAEDREGLYRMTEILADAELFASGGPGTNSLKFTWTNAKVGDHNIVGHVVDESLQDAIAQITIHVVPSAELAVKIVRPANGSVFSLGEIIKIEAQAIGATEGIAKFEILWDGKPLDSTTESFLAVEWSQGDIGDHTIVARVTDAAGHTAAAETHVRIREADAGAFVFRKLPPAYTPGTSFGVELRAEPPPGGRAYAVEDHPPTGWQVGEISNNGFFDSASGKVKFGPFTDTTARTLTYRVTPPASATGRKEFGGTGSIDGVNYAIGGDRIVDQSPTYHPADTDQNFAIVIAELTAYTAAWKRGEPIPVSFVTRAGYIWKHGEAYKFDAALEPPFCWVPLQVPEPRFTTATVTGSERIAADTQPGVSANVKINVTPPGGTSAYAVEEKVPLGWAVSNISNEGFFDSATGVIRWGMFLDPTARTLAYTLTPPAGVSAIAKFGGRVAFDGAVSEIYGSTAVVSTDDTALPQLTKCEADSSGNVRFELKGAAGQVGVLQSSSDLVHWQDVTTVYLPDGTVQFDDNTRASIARYYRVQIR